MFVGCITNLIKSLYIPQKWRGIEKESELEKKCSHGVKNKNSSNNSQNKLKKISKKNAKIKFRSYTKGYRKTRLSQKN